MDIFLKVLAALRAVPDWVYLLLLPALLLPLAVGLFFLRRPKIYAQLAAMLGLCGTACAASEGQEAAIAYIALFSLLAILLQPRILPADKRKKRAERIYREFHEELNAPEGKAEAPLPPKVCCFETPPATEDDIQLDHVTALIQKLKKEKLTASDRLELEALCRTVDGCKNRALTDAERDTLNDCLASVLRMTAKYKL